VASQLWAPANGDNIPAAACGSPFLSSWLATGATDRAEEDQESVRQTSRSVAALPTATAALASGGWQSPAAGTVTGCWPRAGARGRRCHTPPRSPAARSSPPPSPERHGRVLPGRNSPVLAASRRRAARVAPHSDALRAELRKGQRRLGGNSWLGEVNASVRSARTSQQHRRLQALLTAVAGTPEASISSHRHDTLFSRYLRGG